MKTKEVDIFSIKHGDTIVHNGNVVTVTAKDIRRDSFMGITLFGDSYSLGRKPVVKVVDLN